MVFGQTQKRRQILAVSGPPVSNWADRLPDDLKVYI